MADSSDNIQIVIQDKVSDTIAPKLKNIETNALNAMDGLSRMQQALTVVDPSGLTKIATAAKANETRFTGAARAMTAYSQAAVGAASRFDTLTGAIQRNTAALGAQIAVLTEFAAAAKVAVAESAGLARGFNGVGGALPRLRNGMHGTVTDMQALQGVTSLAVGGITGMRRVMERFLSTFSSVAGAARSLYGVLGLFAVAGVLFEVGKNIYMLVEAFQRLSTSERDAEVAAIKAGDALLKVKPDKVSVDGLARFMVGAPGSQEVTIKRAASLQEDQAQEQAIFDANARKNEALAKQRGGTAGEDKQRSADALARATLLKNEGAQVDALIQQYSDLLAAKAKAGLDTQGTTQAGGTAVINGVAVNMGQPRQMNTLDDAQSKMVDQQLKEAIKNKETLEKGAAVDAINAQTDSINARTALDKKATADAKKEDLQRVEDLREGLKVYEETNGSSLEAQKAYWDQYLRTETAGSKAAAAVRKAEETIGAAATTELLKSKAEYAKQVQASLSDIAKESDLSRQSETTDAIKEGTRETLGYLAALRDVAIAERAVNGERALALTQYQAERGLITPAAAAMQEYQIKLGALTDQYNRLSEKIKELQSDPNLGMTGGKDIANLQAQQAQVGTQIGTLRLNQPNNNMTAGNIFGNSQGGLAAEITQAYKPVQELQAAFKGLNDTMIDGTANAMAKAIVNAKSLGDAFKQVGKEIEQQLIGALIKLGLQWVEMQVLQATLGTAAAATATAQATGLAAAWAPAAFGASVATLGGADAIGTSAYATGLAGVQAMSMAHYTSGSNGPIAGRGTTLSDSIPAMLSVGETVVSAADTARNLPTLQAIQSGRPVNQAPNIQVIHDGSTSIQVLPGPTHGDVVFMATQIAQQTVAQNTDAATSAALNNPNSATSRAMRQNYDSGRIR